MNKAQSKIHHITDRIAEAAKQQKRKLLIAVEFIFLAVSLFSFFHARANLVTLELTKEDFASSGFVDGVIDENSPAGFYTLAEFSLPKGYYRYRVDYEGSAPGSTCFPNCFTDRFKSIEPESKYLDDEAPGRSHDLWVRANLNASFCLTYEGEGTVAIHSVTFEQTPAMADQQLFFRMIFFLSANLLLAVWYYRKKYGVKESSVYAAGVVAALTLLASFPVTTGTMFLGHDLAFHLTRIEGLKDGILSGQFPVRINPDFYRGYGYANSIMYGEFLLYFPAFLRMIGFSLTGAYNAYIVLVNLLTAISAYWSFSRISRDKFSGAVAATLYMLTPYRLMDVYVRASAGEYSAMIFLPLVVYGMYRIYTEDVRRKEYHLCFLPLTIGLTGLIQTHTLTVEMTALFVLLTCVLLLKRTFQRERFCALLKTVGAVIMINLWFLIPFADYYLTQDLRIRTRFYRDKIQKTGAYLAQLLSTFNKFAWRNVNGDGSEAAIGEELAFSLGFAFALGLLLCLCMVVTVWKKDRKTAIEALYLSGLGLLATWMATIYFPWDRVAEAGKSLGEILMSVQFSWRYLSPAAALSAAAIAIGLAMLRRGGGEHSQFFYSAAMGLCVLSCIGGLYYMTECMNEGSQLTWKNLEADTHVAAMEGEYVLTKAQYEVVREISDPRTSEGVSIENYSKLGTNIRFDVQSGNADGFVRLPLLAYKGYTAHSDDSLFTRQNLSEGPAAELQVLIPANYSGTVTIRFQGFWYWRAAELLSLLSVIGLIVIYVKNRLEKNP